MLYFVGTPIGNLGDLSYRAVEVLKSADVIACEDTRHSLVLLEHYGIKAKLIAYHKFNENASADGIINLLNEGKNVAVISDAGMPVISDPGNVLTKKLVELNIPFSVVPGANAALCALILSGFDASKFAFFGFLSEKNKELKKQLNEISNFNGSKILYSSKHNVNKDLQSLHSVLGSVKVAVVSELTKLHEKCEIITLPHEISQPIGEYVLVVEQGVVEQAKPSDEQLLSELKILLKTQNKNDAIKIVKDKYNLTKSYIYNLYEKNK